LEEENKNEGRVSEWLRYRAVVLAVRDVIAGGNEQLQLFE